MDEDQQEKFEHLPVVENVWLRGLLLFAGSLSVVLGFIGAFLPVMPTTPFLLLAAVCFARASPRCYRLLLKSPIFGKHIAEWRKHKSLPMKTKVQAVVLIAVTMSVSIVFFVPVVAGKITMAMVGLGVVIYILNIPTRTKSAEEHRSGKD